MIEVDLRLSYLLVSDTYYWTGAVFSSFTVTPTTAWQAMLTNNTWTYGTPIVWPTDGLSHAVKLEARAEDSAVSIDNTGAGNIDVPTTAGTDVMNFTVDDSSPTGSITWPSANASVSSATVIIVGTGSGRRRRLGHQNDPGRNFHRLWAAPNIIGPALPIRSIKPGSRRPPLVRSIIRFRRRHLASSNLYYLRLQLTDFAGNQFTSARHRRSPTIPTRRSRPSPRRPTRPNKTRSRKFSEQRRITKGCYQ